MGERTYEFDATHGRSRQLAVTAMCVLAFLWPTELPIAMFWHGVAQPIIGDAYVLLVHGTCLVALSVLLLAVHRAAIPSGSGDWRWFIATCLGYLGIGIAPLLVSATSGVELKWAYQELVFGYVAPVAFIAATLSLTLRDQQRIWVAFYTGWVWFLAASGVLLLVSWRAADASIPEFEAAPLTQKLIMWRFTLGQPWNLYGIVMGNANKLSNSLVVFLLMSVTLLRLEITARSHRKLLLMFWILAVSTLVVMFSRAAMLLLPMVIVGSGILWELQRRSRWLITGLALSSLIAIGIAAPQIFEYLFAAKYLPDADSDPWGTYNDRLAQWSDLMQFFSAHPRAALTGLGASGYGMRFFGMPEPGTHNTFLDLWAEAGIFSPLLLCVTIGSVAAQIWVGAKSARRRTVTSIGVVAIVLLMTREHSFSYLYVTSLGGLCFVVLLYATIVPDECAPRRDSRDGGSRSVTATI